MISLNREVAGRRIDQEWWHVEGVSERRLREEVDYHWKWKVLVSKSQNNPYVRSMAVVLESGSVEAAMIYRVDAKSVLEPGRRAVLIDRLFTRPRNRDNLSASPCYRGAGSGLLMLAVCQSFILGLEGRVTLFAAGREPFYLDRGFVRTEVIHDEMSLFELPRKRCRRILDRERDPRMNTQNGDPTPVIGGSGYPRGPDRRSCTIRPVRPTMISGVLYILDPQPLI